MMDLIFSKANTVLIWLGFHNEFRPAVAAELFDRMTVEMLEGAPLSDRVSYSSKRPCYTDVEVEILLNVFESEWIWRLWCVQEVVLAKKAWVHWATVKMTWDIFSTVAIYIQAANQGMIARTVLAGIYTVSMLESFRTQLTSKKPLPNSHQLTLTGMLDLTKPSTQPLPFSRLLSLTRLHGVTDRRDRIFSFLSLDHSLCRMSPGTNS
jgi:hypothetical protein